MTERRLEELASQLFDVLLSVESDEPAEWKEKIRQALRQTTYETTEEFGRCVDVLSGLAKDNERIDSKKGGTIAFLAKAKIEACKGMKTIISGRLKALLEAEGTDHADSIRSRCDLDGIVGGQDADRQE